MAVSKVTWAGGRRLTGSLGCIVLITEGIKKQLVTRETPLGPHFFFFSFSACVLKFLFFVVPYTNEPKKS